MSNPSIATGEQLANSLRALGVNFIRGGKGQGESLHKQPARLIAALAESNEARLRLALIPLFLDHPEFAAQVRTAARKLGPRGQVTLACYYSAAVWLQQLYGPQLDALIGRKPSLPDYFSGQLHLAHGEDPEENLQLLAERQRALSGAHINWIGTYKHAAQVWLKGLEIQGA